MSRFYSDFSQFDSWHCRLVGMCVCGEVGWLVGWLAGWLVGGVKSHHSVARQGQTQSRGGDKVSCRECLVDMRLDKMDLMCRKLYHIVFLKDGPTHLDDSAS